MKFGANCGTSLLACRAELVPRLPVMMSARALGPRLPLALARHDSPDHWNSLARGISRYGWRPIQLLSRGLATRGQRCKQDMDWPGSLLSNPAVRTCVCQRNRKAVCSSTSGKLPTTRSSLRRQLRSQLLPSQLRSQLRSLGSQRQRSPGSQRQRRLGSRRSLGSHRSLCSRRSHGLPVPSPEAFPCSPCRRRRTSPG